MKKAGKGIFAPKKLSEALAAICGVKTAPRTEVTKKIWVYIKKNGLNNGRVIKPDAKLKLVFPGESPGHSAEKFRRRAGRSSRSRKSRARVFLEWLLLITLLDFDQNFCRCISHVDSGGGEARQER